jgi:glycosyltransferase involved in cell wall biosynthesis
LIHKLCRDNEIHLISWRHCKKLSEVSELGRLRQNTTDYGIEYVIGLTPLFSRFVGLHYPEPWCVAHNQYLFRRQVLKIIQQVKPDVAIYADSFHFTGFPPFDTGVRTIFDYVDKSRFAKTYLKNSDAAVGVTAALCDELGRDVNLVPNGVDVARYRSCSKQEAKLRLGFNGKQVISLIGLTLSPRLYFLDAIAGLDIDRSRLAILVVGQGSILSDIRRRAHALGLSENLVTPDFVPNRDIHWYFAASDVGLYPGEDIPYYNEAAPLKVIEYTAASVPVVSSPVLMFAGWPNVRQVAPSADPFRDAMQRALAEPSDFQDVRELDWERIAERLLSVMRAVERGQEPEAGQPIGNRPEPWKT